MGFIDDVISMIQSVRTYDKRELERFLMAEYGFRLGTAQHMVFFALSEYGCDTLPISTLLAYIEARFGKLILLPDRLK
jgi:hypothetical protein